MGLENEDFNVFTHRPNSAFQPIFWGTYVLFTGRFNKHQQRCIEPKRREFVVSQTMDLIDSIDKQETPAKPKTGKAVREKKTPAAKDQPYEKKPKKGEDKEETAVVPTKDAIYEHMVVMARNFTPPEVEVPHLANAFVKYVDMAQRYPFFQMFLPDRDIPKFVKEHYPPALDVMMTGQGGSRDIKKDVKYEKLTEERETRRKALELVDLTHFKLFCREHCKELPGRPCRKGESCVCRRKYLPSWPENGFVGVEFMLPSEYKHYHDTQCYKTPRANLCYPCMVVELMFAILFIELSRKNLDSHMAGQPFRVSLDPPNAFNPDYVFVPDLDDNISSLIIAPFPILPIANINVYRSSHETYYRMEMRVLEPNFQKAAIA